VKLTTHLHLVPRLRMSGAIPTLPFMSSWRVQDQIFNIPNIVRNVVLSYVNGIYLLHCLHSFLLLFHLPLFFAIFFVSHSLTSSLSSSLVCEPYYFKYACLSSPSFHSSSFPFLPMYVTIAITCYSLFSFFSIPSSPSPRCCLC
jgi:hypothetical protein